MASETKSTAPTTAEISSPFVTDWRFGSKCTARIAQLEALKNQSVLPVYALLVIHYVEPDKQLELNEQIKETRWKMMDEVAKNVSDPTERARQLAILYGIKIAALGWWCNHKDHKVDQSLIAFVFHDGKQNTSFSCYVPSSSSSSSSTQKYSIELSASLLPLMPYIDAVIAKEKHELEVWTKERPSYILQDPYWTEEAEKKRGEANRLEQRNMLMELKTASASADSFGMVLFVDAPPENRIAREKAYQFDDGSMPTDTNWFGGVISSVIHKALLEIMRQTMDVKTMRSAETLDRYLRSNTPIQTNGLILCAYYNSAKLVAFEIYPTTPLLIHSPTAWERYANWTIKSGPLSALGLLPFVDKELS